MNSSTSFLYSSPFLPHNLCLHPVGAMQSSAARSWLKTHRLQSSLHTLNILAFAVQTSSQHLSSVFKASTTAVLGVVRVAELHCDLDTTALSSSSHQQLCFRDNELLRTSRGGKDLCNYTSAAMGGYGVNPVNGVVSAGALMSSSVIAIRAYRMVIRGC